MSELPDERKSGSNMKNMINGKKPSLKFNALSNTVSLGINVLTGFYVTRIVVGHLDEMTFGMWMLTSSVVGYFSLLQMGVGTGVMRYVPLYRGQGQQDKVSATVSTGMAFYSGVGLLILLLSVVFGNLIAEFFNGGALLATLIRIVGLAAALECPFYIYDAVLRSYEKFALANFLTNFKAIAKAVMTWLCLYLGYGVIGLSWTLVVVNIIMLAACHLMFRLACRDVHLGIRSLQRSEVKILTTYGIAILIASVGDTLTFGMAKPIIGKLVSLEAVGMFGVVAMLANYYRRTVYAITKVFMPRFSFLQGSNADDEIKRLFLRSTRYVTIFTGLVGVVLWTLGPAFMRLWLQKDFSSAVPTLMVLIGGMLVLGSNRMVIDMLYGLGKQHVLAVFSVIEGTATIILSIGLAFVLPAEHKMLGVAAGMCVPVAIMRGIVQPYYACRLTQMSLRQYYGQRILRLWLLTGGLSAVMAWLGLGIFAATWLKFFIASFIVISVYLAIVYAAAMDKEERMNVKHKILARFKKRGQATVESPIAEEVV
ncbi:MAG: oligosaccharide flippase family protein [Sedimentisphaerales bacterium]|nr:oligosaccharide flippase family protein [Sedimentisphaerales bacterium]